MTIFAEDRSSTTQFELAEVFEKGDNRTQDYAEAFKWYRESARKGYRSAQSRLGTLYARGLGVDQNLIKAYAWYLVARFQRSRRATRLLKVIERKLSMEQKRKARLLAEQYRETFTTD